ncbi:uncharacterized protein G2W53_003566 [Senna tora]|uniref:SWIM-type domain-containing protein n=1 Tax=Senna tora TaxID=362788 RepID=A0A834X8Z8_9FABA|nr:uncharacterized protein G2W53_003566 [Senna tora]
MSAVQQAMPGTEVSFQTVDMPGDDNVVQFKRMFWAFKPCIDAWWQLKPMLQVDGTFLLREHVVKDREVCLISDRGTEFLAALDNPGTGRPRVTHRASARRLEAIRTLKKDVARWIENIPREKWTRAYDGGRRYIHMTTNLAKCMNNVLNGVRCLPVTVLVQATFYKVAEFFNNRRQQVQAQINTGHVLCEDLRDTIFTNLEIVRICKVTLRNEDLGEFEVEEPYNQKERRPDRRCRVYLGRRLCDCGEFQQLHLPCIHPQVVGWIGNLSLGWVQDESRWVVGLNWVVVHWMAAVVVGRGGDAEGGRKADGGRWCCGGCFFFCDLLRHLHYGSLT